MRSLLANAAVYYRPSAMEGQSIIVLRLVMIYIGEVAAVSVLHHNDSPHLFQ